MLCIGIDPGKSGGIAIINTETLSVILHKMPENETALADLIDAATTNNHYIICEEQAARGRYESDDAEQKPHFGMKSLWSFAIQYATIRGILVALKTRREYLRPKAWHKILGLRARRKGESQTEWKNFLKQKAQEMFPAVASKITLAVADALLIAEVCYRLHGRGISQNRLRPEAWNDL